MIVKIPYKPRHPKVHALLESHRFITVMRSDGRLEMHEVKGYWHDDARVKIKVAAEMYPVEFLAVRKKTRREGIGWKIETF